MLTLSHGCDTLCSLSNRILIPCRGFCCALACNSSASIFKLILHRTASQTFFAGQVIETTFAELFCMLFGWHLKHSSFCFCHFDQKSCCATDNNTCITSYFLFYMDLIILWGVICWFCFMNPVIEWWEICWVCIYYMYVPYYIL